MTGSKDGETYTFPCEYNLPIPKSIEDFIALESISKENILSWIETDPSNAGYKEYIESAINKKLNPPEEETYFSGWLPDPATNQAAPSEDDNKTTEEGGD